MSQSPKALSEQDLLHLLGSIRRAPGQEGDYAPHKPLTLLLALARIQQGHARLVSFHEVEPQLKGLLQEFARTGAEKTRNLPYWRLKNDHGGALWEVTDPTHRVHIDAVDPPGLTAMRASSIEAGFSPPVFAALKRSPAMLSKVARAILEGNFPATLHQDIAQAVGLDLAPVDLKVEEEQPGQAWGRNGPARRPRNPAFRNEVLRAYEYRCCVCGFDLRVGHLPAGLEAAHIQWHTVGGPDVVANGLSLCALHHKLFDLGAFTVEPGELRIVFSQHAITGDRSSAGELRHHGQVLSAPQQSDMRPGQAFLAWNARNVFKGPARRWAA